MNKKAVVAVLCVCLAGVSGCLTASNTRRQVDPVREEIRDRADAFLSLVIRRDYRAIRPMILPRQAQGFNAGAFVEGRFRMKANHFDLVAWDRLAIQATPLKNRPGMLSSAPVSVRVLATNEIKTIYVNLHWRKQAGKWYINAFPNQ